ncbi:hypothetical protein BaRGS_00003538, partial [Batillaria attramentaria]
YLKKNCRSTYKFSRDVVLGYSPASTDFTKKYFCETTIRTTDLGRHLQLRFIFLDLKKSTDCNVARILITDTNNKTVLTPATGVCGTKRPSQLYRTSGNTVAVSLSTDSTPFNWGDFEILITRRRRYYIRIKETAQPYHAVNVSSSGYSPSYVTQYN